MTTRQYATLCLISSLSLLAGCATPTGYNKSQMLNELSGVSSPAVAGLQSIQKPLKIAVYFQKPQTVGEKRPTWDWSPIDRSRVFHDLARLKDDKRVSAVFPVEVPANQPVDLQVLKSLAREHGADALLVIEGIDQIDQYTNRYGWSYALLLPALFAPGTDVDAFFLSRATLLSVYDASVYVAVEGEGMSKQRRAVAYVEPRQAVEAARSAALGQITNELVVKF